MPQIDIVSVTITHEIYGKNKKRALPNVMDLKWTTQNFLHLSPPKYFPSHSFTYTVFGWGEFRKDGKPREENRVENSIFHCLANERK